MTSCGVMSLCVGLFFYVYPELAMEPAKICNKGCSILDKQNKNACPNK